MSWRSSLRTSSSQVVRPSYAIKPAYRSPFHTSTVQFALKESDKDGNNLPQFYEAQKEDQLKSSKEGKAKWKAELASNSEADVKADRGEIESDDATFQSMQERTKNLPNRKGPVNKTQ